MKQREISQELVKKTVDTLDEVENAILGVQTGVTAGNSFDGYSPAPDYGCPSPCTSAD